MTTHSRRKVVFLTGTRADFGKLKPLMNCLRKSSDFEVHVFVTGMHMLSKYGYTCEEVVKAGFTNIYKYINQNSSDSMDHILAKTITGLSDYIREISPELLIVHGDRVEALAGASVGALNNVLTGHIEGGEVSGTIDELIRHAVTKMSHIHFVSNEAARVRLIQLGEREETIFSIGSPDIDVMNSPALPSIDDVRRYYGFEFHKYGILLFHPVTSELAELRGQIQIVVDELIASGLNYIVIYPNNDPGTDFIISEYARLADHPQFKIYPSMRFEYFLSLLKHSQVIIGNSSAGVREAPHFGVPAINLGSRQKNRTSCDSIIHVDIDHGVIKAAINHAMIVPRFAQSLFGDGASAQRFYDILNSSEFWKTETQKYFVDQSIGAGSR
ncbi:MAG: UDP-N-acetylglucosamine 2-epimerase [Chloroflexi bacterium]|nr:UDP-N-acetylglucosamine 2-epimerase [Chloroflexota bacterium]